MKKNTDVFQDYDMVVSMSEDLINSQLIHLTQLGTIRSSLIMQQIPHPKTKSFTYKILDDASSINKDLGYINAEIIPQISIPTGGTKLTLLIKLLSGEAQLWIGEGPFAKLTKTPIDNWVYAITVNMNLKNITGDIKNLKIPANITKQLTHFTEDMFTVNSLFLDFESSVLDTFDPAATTVGKAGDEFLKALTFFMSFYFTSLKTSGNPYVLGYSINQTDQTKPPKNEQVSDSLKPVATNYSMYQDSTDAKKSNLNYLLVTKGGFDKLPGSPDIFPSNWIGASENIDAKMIISHQDLIEKLVLKPLFNQLQNNIYTQIQDKLDDNIYPGNSYEEGKTITSTGMSFVVANELSDDDNTDQYKNTFDVSFDNQSSNQNDDGSAIIQLSGSLYFHKESSESMPFCTARARATITQDWSGSITIKATKDKDGKPSLSMSHNISASNPNTSTSKNDCADAWSEIGEILGAIIDGFTGFLDDGFFAQLLSNALSTHVSGLGSLQTVTPNLPNLLNNTILLPAGGVFYFKNPAIDNEGNFSLDLTYKSEH